MNSHPPIPPNCSMFGLYQDGVAYFRFKLHGVENKLPLNESYRSAIWHSDARTIIASVATCAWELEAERMLALFDDNAKVTHENSALYAAAVANSKAWREWRRDEYS